MTPPSLQHGDHCTILLHGRKFSHGMDEPEVNPLAIWFIVLQCQELIKVLLQSGLTLATLTEKEVMIPPNGLVVRIGKNGVLHQITFLLHRDDAHQRQELAAIVKGRKVTEVAANFFRREVPLAL